MFDTVRKKTTNIYRTTLLVRVYEQGLVILEEVGELKEYSRNYADFGVRLSVVL